MGFGRGWCLLSCRGANVHRSHDVHLSVSLGLSNQVLEQRF